MSLLLWLRGKRQSCDHARLTGVANYYIRETQSYMQLSRCDDCGLSILEET